MNRDKWTYLGNKQEGIKAGPSGRVNENIHGEELGII